MGVQGLKGHILRLWNYDFCLGVKCHCRSPWSDFYQVQSLWPSKQRYSIYQQLVSFREFEQNKLVLLQSNWHFFIIFFGGGGGAIWELSLCGSKITLAPLNSSVIQFDHRQNSLALHISSSVSVSSLKPRVWQEIAVNKEWKVKRETTGSCCFTTQVRI